MHPLPRIGAMAALLGGGLRIVAQFIPYTPGSAALEGLYGVIDLAFLFALVALIGVLAGRIAVPALALLLAALAGVASIVGPDARGFGVDFYLAGSALFTLALGAASVWLVRVPGLARAAWAWIAAALAGVASALGGGEIAFAAAGLSLAVGFVLLGQWLWTLRPAQDERIAR